MDQCRPERHAVFVEHIYNAVFNSITQREIVFSRTSSGGGLLQFSHDTFCLCSRPVSNRQHVSSSSEPIQTIKTNDGTLLTLNSLSNPALNDQIYHFSSTFTAGASSLSWTKLREWFNSFLLSLG